MKVKEFTTDGLKILGHYMGQVVDRNDPEGKARIKVNIPGFLSPSSDWIRPYGIFDGSGGRGIFWVPKVGANVKILFLQGNGDKQTFARYTSGNWGAQGGTPEVPVESLGGNPDIVVFAFDGFAIVVDERTGQKKTTFLDRVNNSLIRFDIETKNIELVSMNDFDTTVQHDKSETVTNDRNATIGANDSSNVTGDSTLSCNKRSVTTVGDDERTVGGAWKINVTGNAEITADQNVVVNAKAQLQLKTDQKTVMQADAPDGNPLIDGTTEVKIGRLATEFVALKTQLKAWCDGHVHLVAGIMVGPAAATSGIAVPPVPDTAFSTKMKAE